MLVWFCGNFKRHMKQFFLEFPKRRIPLKAFSNFPKPFSEYFRFMWYCFLNFGCSIDETIRCFSEIQKFFNLENMYQWQNWRVSMGLSTDQLSLSLIKVNHVKQWVSISKTRTRGLGRDLGVAWSRSPCYVFYFIFSFFPNAHDLSRFVSLLCLRIYGKWNAVELIFPFITANNLHLISAKTVEYWKLAKEIHFLVQRRFLQWRSSDGSPCLFSEILIYCTLRPGYFKIM